MSENENNNEIAHEDSNELILQRHENMRKLVNEGIDPFTGDSFTGIQSIDFVKANFVDGASSRIAGRIMAQRLMGKTIFLDLKDFSGRMQLYVKKDFIGEKGFNIFKIFDIGDIIGVDGTLFKTHSGEVTVLVKEFKFLSKSLHPLPEKWHGLKDVEVRYRERYTDLIVNDTTRDIFKKRIKIIQSIRNYLNDKSFLEVETPMMHSIAGGAAGKPFKTHHETLDMALFLRIAPEIYLKKLLVGGFEKIYEINRSFRNEGISTRHNPEFTMIEIYEAYSDCEGMMRLTEDMIRTVARLTIGTEVFEYQGRTIDLTHWKRVSFRDLMKQNFDINVEDPMEMWADKLKKNGVDVPSGKLSKTQLVKIIGDLVEPKEETHPVFVVDMFKEISPLAKEKKDEPGITARFELFMGGMEIANAYSELNDPIDQKKRFIEQVKEDPDARIDDDFIHALEYGMPPAGGLGIGIDRLTMILTNAPSIREVILFPQLRG
ncbi:lysyl-tRNA synthetase [Candidatus Omnitrophus magneticus]|uniref:Lysine--tRNA ligase n=1 Tax=Candidatus Omnitrophus magneticus TaxID=1609969 RepID=A0A0F0CRJ6_9BACT|nr:lysyl-tRNA synthetase [Candidatus Omnitrophus magneticus]